MVAMTDLTERGLESLIVRHLTGEDGLAATPLAQRIAEGPVTYGGSGYYLGAPADYDPATALDVAQLLTFLRATQGAKLAKLGIADPADPANTHRRDLLARLSRELTARGVVDVLRRGLKHRSEHLDLWFGTPTPGNDEAARLHRLNRLSVTRQLHFGQASQRPSIDLCVFVNGLPFATIELKNTFTGQDYRHAIEQYKRDRDPRELLFQPGRCAVHIALDELQAHTCTVLRGGGSKFLPFNRGHGDGAGNPPVGHGLRTSYVWEGILAPASLANILENFAHQVKKKAPKGDGLEVIWPRYHQLDAVRRLLEDVKTHGAGRRYLIQHSAGSGKSRTIAWLVTQLVGARGPGGGPAFNSVVVVTDRRLLDGQLGATVQATAQMRHLVARAESAQQLRQHLREGRKIIVTTVQKFPHIHEAIDDLKDRTFAIVIDEAHSGQGGRASTAVNAALGGSVVNRAPVATPTTDDTGGVDDPEDSVNNELERRIRDRKLLDTASYFAFTATPKNRTLELFGTPDPADGSVARRPFHAYSMKQAILEGFILDVLQNVTPIDSYYTLGSRIPDDPEFDAKRARRRLHRYVEGHPDALRAKAEIVAEHFLRNVAHRIGTKARAMIVCDGIANAIAWWRAISAALVERRSEWRAIIAFSGEHAVDGVPQTETSLNGFPSNDIAAKVCTDPYRILVCADKFQTGYDEPLMHTMYVDKMLSGVKAVQTLSRLNRACPDKHDTFVLDFRNPLQAIEDAFQPFYRATLLAAETDPNKLHDLKAELDAAGVYDQAMVDHFAKVFLSAAPREELEPLLSPAVEAYTNDLDSEQQIKFKGGVRTFCRTYDFLAAVLPWGHVAWESLSIFLSVLVHRLPAPLDEDLAKGILESVTLDAYRLEKRNTTRLLLVDDDGLIDPIPIGSAGGGKPEPEMDRLSNIIKAFNAEFGADLPEGAGPRLLQRLQDNVAPRVATDQRYVNAAANTPHNARSEHDAALGRAMETFLQEDITVYKMYVENQVFKSFVDNFVYRLNTEPPLAYPTA